MALTAPLRLSGTITFTKTPEITSPSTQTIQSIINLAQTLVTLTDGTGLNKANLLYADTRTLAGAATENLNMNTLLDPMGAAQTWLSVKFLAVILNTTTVGASLQVGGLAATTAWNSFINASDDAEITLGPGGSVILSNPSAIGYPVADVTNHLLKILNDSSPSISETYTVIAIGATAQS